ncbi:MULTISPECIES: hypothetical protein [unclassified Kitasatospora]|uniref:hypothetical protein n=1 Tax=unclassified Kitasatospora TaxID=2633591 RepID=UPI0037F1AB0A
MSERALRVVVADDQALVRTGFRLILESEGIEVVAAYETGLVNVGTAAQPR